MLKQHKTIFIQILLFTLLISSSQIQSLEIINSYIEKTVSLLYKENYKIFYYYPMNTNPNHDVILQLTSNSNIGAQLCIKYFPTNEPQIDISTMIQNFEICDNSYTLNSNSKYEEFIITKKIDDISIQVPYLGLYCIIFTVPYIRVGQKYEFSFKVFTTYSTVNIPIDQKKTNNLQNWFVYKNNYLNKDYQFKLCSSLIYKKNVHLQIASINDETKFDLNITTNENIIIYNISNISSLNYYFNISEYDNYYIDISFKKNADKFAIYFESFYTKNQFLELSDSFNHFTFLSNSDYYFYKDITNLKEDDKLFFVLNYLTFNKRYYLSYKEMNIDIENYDYDKLYSLALNENISYTDCNYGYDSNLIVYFKYTKKSDNNILFLKLTASGNFNVEIDEIYFKEYQRKIFDGNTEDSKFFEEFKSDLIIDKIAYIYIPKTAINLQKYFIIYNSNPDTMNVYYGDYDIVDKNSSIKVNSQIRCFRFYFGDDDSSEGYTILAMNNNEDYFIQILEINELIYNNFHFHDFTALNHYNEKLEIKTKINELYYLYINNKGSNFIIDPNVIYGNFSFEYIDLDIIDKNNFNLKELLTFNNSYVNKCNYQILTNSSSILMKITNNILESENLYKGLIYLNKYKVEKIFIDKNDLIPIYLAEKSSIEYTLGKEVLGLITYQFKLGNDYLDYDSNDFSVKIEIGENIFILNKNITEIHGDNLTIIYGNTIKFTNNYIGGSCLIWVKLGGDLNIYDDVETLFLSQNSYYSYNFNKPYILSFDWFNINKKINKGLIPKKIHISISNENSIRTYGYYHQVIIKETENKELDTNNYIIYKDMDNSIYYQLEGGNSIDFYDLDNINITEFNYYFKNNTYLNTMILPESGSGTINFYIEYLYNIKKYRDYLQELKFDDSINSVNLDFSAPELFSKKYKFIFFQCLLCQEKSTKITAKLNKLIYSEGNWKNSNAFIKSITNNNIIGYLNVANISQNENNKKENHGYINIINPYAMFIKYYYLDYSSNFDINVMLNYSNNYNINIEKVFSDNRKKFIIYLSFDSFIKNIQTNYSILILNKTGKITNECEFFSLIKENNSIINNYIWFIDDNNNTRIKKELPIDNDGNYIIYILAQTSNDFSFYKLLGSESYSFDSSGKITESKLLSNQGNFWAVLIIIILIVILFIIIFIFHYVRKKRLNDHTRLYNFVKEKNKKSIESTDNNSNSSNRSEPLLYSKPGSDNCNSDTYSLLSSEANNRSDSFEQNEAAPLFEQTFKSEEDKIKFELKKLNEVKDNDDNSEIKYVNGSENLITRTPFS